MGRLGAGVQRVLLSPLEPDSPIDKGGLMMKNLSVAKAPAITISKWGDAVQLSADAEAAGSKGDFTLAGEVPGKPKVIGMWVFLSPTSNVDRLGFQIYDGEGESFLSAVPADWQGWKWVELDLSAAAPAQAWAQTDKNKAVDFPLKSVHVAWFSKGAGTSSFAVDALVAATQLDTSATLKTELSGATSGERGAPMAPEQVLFTNFGDQPRTTKVEYTLQRDPNFTSVAVPDAQFGADRALGARSWGEAEGNRIDEGSLTDGKRWTNAALPWGSHKEATQTVDLGREIAVTHLAYEASDANWAWKMDISASADGQNFAPVAGLQSIDAHGKWGHQDITVAAPFKARFLRLRHHNDGKEVNQISMPSSLSVYSALADADVALPLVGETISRGTLSTTIPARSFSAATVEGDKPLSSGAYLLSMQIGDGTQKQLLTRHFFVFPESLPAISPDSRFGLNTAEFLSAPWHRQLGIGWVRFENLKWPMVSPRAGAFTFHGVAPWNLNHDTIFSGFRAQGLNVLPFLFQTPDYATSAPAEITKNRDSYPPRDNAQMGDFVFQTVARYGSKKHPASELKTDDKVSGLNQIHTFEIWNEPNLNDPGWGPWVGTNAQYNEMFRVAAESVKRADPTARVTNGGLAGIDVGIVNNLLAPYADGKKPIDFVDTLNVHFYSGRTAPELSNSDPNSDRTGTGGNGHTYEQDLARLVAWRDNHKPGMPIWMSETGYDSAGPFGTDETYQAAQMPRDIMLALASGIDKVFVFRDSGSSPSMFAASGVVRDDGSYKPSWFTYATLIRQLDGVQTGALRLPFADTNVRVFAWTRGQETILSAWTTEKPTDINLKLGQSTVTDSFGATKTQNIAGKLSLSMFPIYIKNIGDQTALKSLIGQAQHEQNVRRAEVARLSKLRAYLFDFGGREHIGTIDIGDSRAFTPVMGTEVFDAAKGYGFFPVAAGQDSDRHWISDPLERDSTRMNPDHSFRFVAKPGRYQLRAGINPQAAAHFSIKGAVGGDKTFAITHDGPAISTEVEVGADAISISNDGYGDMMWPQLNRATSAAG